MHLHEALAQRVGGWREQGYPQPEGIRDGILKEAAATEEDLRRAGEGQAAITVEGRKAVALRQWEALNADRLKYDLVLAREDTASTTSCGPSGALWGGGPAMDPERFKGTPSGRLVRAGRGTAGYWAFAPHPLPPGLELSPPLVHTLSQADRALGELAGLGRSLANPHLLINPFIRREAVLSSRIEGTQASIADLYAYEAGQLPLPGLAETDPTDVREVANYVQALEYALARLESLPVSLRLLREVHQRLLAGVRGEHSTPGQFRTSQNWIGRPGCTLNEASYVPPPVDEMKEALGALERYLHAEDDPYPPLVRLACIHYQFEAIHPFLDGNGRVGRLLTTLLLVHWGLLPLPLLYLSAYFEAQRDDYYRLLFGVSERGAWEEWVGFYLRGVMAQAQDAVGRARELQDLQLGWREQLAEGRASPRALRLLDIVFATPVLTIPQAQRLLDCGYPAAQRAVEKLVAAGVLRQAGAASYGKVFVAKRVLGAAGHLES